MPCIVWWPGTTPAGTICNQLASSIDLLPTFAEIAGTPLPAKQIDGVSIRSLFEACRTPRHARRSCSTTGKTAWKPCATDTTNSCSPIREAFPPGNGGRPGKVAEGHEFPLALYDMRRDPGERYDVQNQHRSGRGAMRIADAGARTWATTCGNARQEQASGRQG